MRINRAKLEADTSFTTEFKDIENGAVEITVIGTIQCLEIQNKMVYSILPSEGVNKQEAIDEAFELSKAEVLNSLDSYIAQFCGMMLEYKEIEA